MVLLLVAVFVLRLASPGDGPPKLALAHFTASVEGDGIHAEAHVVNTTDVRLVGAAWWHLSLTDASDAWLDRVYTSLSRDLDLKAGESARLEWSESPAIPAGSYRLSAWVHTTDLDGTSTHSDSRSAANPIVDLDGPIDLARAWPQTGEFVIIGGSSRVVPGFPTNTEVSIDLRGSSDSPQAIDLEVQIVEATSSDPRWWTYEPAGIITGGVTVPAEQDAGSVLQAPLMLKPGDYVLAVAGRSDSGSTDRVLLLDSEFSVLEFDDSTKRDRMPDGPLMVTSIDAPTSWSANETPVVAVTVKNTSQSAVMGTLWWHLGDPGDPAPWESAAATSYRLDRQFGPAETRTIRLTPEGILPIGNLYELSVWAHYVGDALERRHSDGVRFPALINIGERVGGEDLSS